ncbi:Hypothetical protein FKW44_012381, partial [Caligus rogercresseyi]
KEFPSAKSWNQQMNDFLQSLESDEEEGASSSPGVSPPINREEKERKNEESDVEPNELLLPPGVDSGEGTEYESSPLICFIGRRLRHLQLEPENGGLLSYPVLSLLSRSEWIAAKSLSLLEKAGFGMPKIYELGVSSPSNLEMSLKTAVFTGRVPLEGNPEVIQKVLRVIECLKEYFSSNEGGQSSEEEPEEEEVASPLVKNAMGPFLKQLNESLQTKEEEESRRAEEEQQTIPEPQVENPWKQMSDSIQSQNLSSFHGIKNSIAKDLLRLHGRQVDAFPLAQEMVSCWVLAGFGLESLRQSVLMTPFDQILNAENPKSLSFRLFHRLLRHKEEFPPIVSEEHLRHLVKKTLSYIMKGIQHHKKAPPNYEQKVNIIFNYLPPGLREAESAASASQPPLCDPYVPEADSAGVVPASPQKQLPKEPLFSEDPLNAVLNSPKPSARDDPQASRPNHLPNRKYNLVTLHLEWVVLKGIPQIYELSAYSSSDMSVLNLYCVPPCLKNSPETLENLGFVSNPDRHEFYFVQVGIGCVKALSLETALGKLSSFLEEKRNISDSENRNNGLIILTHTSEELGNFLTALSDTSNNNLLINVIKGLGSLESFIGRNKSKKYFFGGPRLAINGEDVSYETEVRKGIATQTLLSKSNPLGVFPSQLQHFIEPYCIPSLGNMAQELQTKASKVRELYTLEVFISAHLKAQKVPLFLEGAFAPLPIRDLRDKASVVANRIVFLLVEAGFDKAKLSGCFAKDTDFAINSNVFLNSMNMSQRLKVMDQTMRCIHIIKNFYL